jgi:S-adenosylmethionine:tRNA ribosyltransferase-isomerase
MGPTHLRTEDFDYSLPEGLIASRPLDRRDASRMMVVDRASGRIDHLLFRDFPGFASGRLAVLNDTRVARARYYSSDGKVELLRLDAIDPLLWKCLVRPGKKMRQGAEVRIGDAVGFVEEILADGSRLVRFDRPVDEQLHGHLALPHYMKRDDDAADDMRYQTIFSDPAKQRAIAAPTAGLHFTPEILASVEHVFVTLHVGVGTFQPVRAEFIRDHVMHTETYEISPRSAEKINAAADVLAVGTTVTRVLEHSMAEFGAVAAGSGQTNIFIHPGFTFRKVGALLTNFHLPKSTLFMLVCAFAGTELMRSAYAAAVAGNYRFYSYGDCMLIR